MHIKIVLWWVGYVFFAIIVQRNIPGLDALIPSYLLALQYGSKRLLFILFILFSLIQEGTGNIVFGSSILWYLGTVILFYLSTGLFLTTSVAFIVYISLTLGIYHACVLWLMCTVQDIPIDYFFLARETIHQIFATPILWGIAYFLYPKSLRHEN